jgi:hypothetical protein
MDGTSEGMALPSPGASAGYLEALARAVWGAAVGFAVVMTGIGLWLTVHQETGTRVNDFLLGSRYTEIFLNVHWQEWYEGRAYLLLCVLCPLTAFAAIRYLRAPAWAAALSTAAFVPMATWACDHLFRDNKPVAYRLPLLAVLLPPLAWGLGRRSPVPAGVPDRPVAPSGYPWTTTVLLGLPLTGLFIAFLWPFHATIAGSYCQDQTHVASFLVGPALYYRAPGVVPGLDFESHYGIGHAYLFSFFCPDGLIETMGAYVVYMAVVSILYFLSAYLVLVDWFRRPVPAALTTLVLLGATIDGIHLVFPSNWPVRHPFVFVFLFFGVRGAAPGRSWWWSAGAGLVAGVSLFWQTDIGLLTMLAGAAFLGGCWWFQGMSGWRIPAFGAGTVVGFFGLCVACFGPRTLSPLFVQRLLEPVLLYGGGFGSELLTWKHGWWYLYNLVGPGVALATVGVALTRGSGQDQQVRYAFLTSVLGLGILFKWVNRSLDQVWMLNGGLVLAVLCWWVWVGWQALAQRWLRDPTRSALGRAREAFALACLVGVGFCLADLDRRLAIPNHRGGSSSPVVRIQQNARGFPSLFANWLKPIPSGPCPNRIAPDKMAFVRDRTGPRERVALISSEDWMYLVDAGRAPRFHWTPIGLIHSPQLLSRCFEDLRQADRVFVEDGALEWLRKINARSYDQFLPVLENDFEIVESSGGCWQVYQQRHRALAGR